MVTLNTYGTAGASLTDGSFTADAFVARGAAEAEVRTARILDAAATGGVAVMHDLDIPVRTADGGRPNIDHVLITGKTIWVVDSKWWKPGFLWTFAGRTRRGMTPFPSADKQTVAMACDVLAQQMAAAGITGVRVRGLVVIWPTTSKTRMHTWALTFPGAKAMSPAAFKRWSAGIKHEAADPHISVALARLVRTR